MGCAPSKEEPGQIALKDVQADVAINSGRRMTETKRRIAVRAETTDLEEAFTPPTYPKSEDAKDRIRQGVVQNAQGDGLLKELTAQQKEDMINAMIEVTCKAGDLVIKQGEDGDHFYLVDSGKFEVYLKQSGEKALRSYDPGDSFGELALLYNSARAATVKCVEDGVLWALERKAFRYVMVSDGSRDIAYRAENFLKTVEILSPLTDAQRADLASVMEELDYTDGQYVVQMGETADALYFVKEGEVVCHQRDKGSDKSADLMRLKKGGVFGESCLEPSAKDAVRKANVVAVGKTVMLKLSRDNFLEQLGPLTELIAHNFKRKVLEGMMIDGTQIFTALPSTDQEQLIAKLTEKVFANGAKIIEQGAANNTFYIIKSGAAKVRQEKGTPRELAELGPGQFFGERALLKAEPASASIVVSSELVAYCCDRETFTTFFGSVQALIDKEVERRERQAQQKAEAPEWSDLEHRRILGVGTFGRVRLVKHKPTNKAFALKAMRKQQVVATKQQSHVLNEKRILASMDHPFVLRLMATYQDEGELYMLLELALGGELFSLLAKRAPLSDKDARFYASQVVSIFNYMHGLKVIYRDLKPENLLLDEFGYLKMVDFGFAKILHDRTWTLCGTPEYLAPEIILNKGHGYGADWWCVGILTYECLMGTTPFVASDPMEGYRKIIKCRVVWPSQFTAAARDFIDRLLCVDPSRRLGCLKNGPADVKNHPWFVGLDWRALEAKKLPAPHVPKIKSPFDDSNFDHYEDDGVKNYPQSDFPKQMFIEFAETWVGK
jgi:cGMP-dependent protein kinase